jgi:hypothetical protein
MNVSQGLPAAIAAPIRRRNQSSRPSARRAFQITTMRRASRSASSEMASRTRFSSLLRRRSFVRVRASRAAVDIGQGSPRGAVLRLLLPMCLIAKADLAQMQAVAVRAKRERQQPS